MSEVTQESEVRREDDPGYVVGSGNVFADLGKPDPEESVAKAELARRIGGIIRERSLSQSQAADLLEIDQPKVSRLLRGQLAGFSPERLLRFLLTLGRDVEIVVRETTTEGRGQLTIAAHPLSR